MWDSSPLIINARAAWCVDTGFRPGNISKPAAASSSLSTVSLETRYVMTTISSEDSLDMYTCYTVVVRYTRGLRSHPLRVHLDVLFCSGPALRDVGSRPNFGPHVSFVVEPCLSFNDLTIVSPHFKDNLAAIVPSREFSLG